ncbi:nucleoside triphosphate pyrophosphohydrolase [Acinetobacter baumannii]|nr:nucleoside triphosphate pyrophosphohydrolase [Acinetobacter baumannii]
MVEKKNSSQNNTTAFSPENLIQFLTKNGLQQLAKSQITSEKVGMKAYGLSCLPEVWVPDFIVINADDFKYLVENEPQKIKDALTFLNWSHDLGLYIRSSAINETINQRGTYQSYETNFDSLIETLKVALDYSESNSHKLHWIIQKIVRTKTKGHLSNERRVGKSLRDFVLEPESSSSQASKNKAVRPWRDGDLKTPKKLDCKDPVSIDKNIKPVMLWTYEKKVRLHFEWVWDGNQIWIVQADQCNKEGGEIPENLLLQQKIREEFDYTALKIFRKVEDHDFQSFKKLDNARIYKEELGFDLVDFYILDVESEVKKIISGSPSDVLKSDIALLIAQGPLVIRTDKKNKEKQMLPRSDELRSIEAVINWFSVALKDEHPDIIDNISDYIFICHNFIPAIASAWSFAEPNKRTVRIEALWGIPEGMYWFSHDVYEVDTQNLDTRKAEINISKFKISPRIRYKDRFIAPNEQGKWITYKTDERCDWKDTLSDIDICKGIAINSRKLADLINEPVNIMWFIKAYKNGKVIKYMPWYHHKFELDKSKIVKVSKFKQPDNYIYYIHTLEDWRHIKNSPDRLIDRLIILPREEEIIRNDTFIEEISKFVLERDIVIELHGGILSHAFYILQKNGCKVEVNDLFGKKEDTLVFKKIVRDNIPENIEFKGESVVQKQVHGDLLTAALKAKLVEESLEVFDATSTTEIIEEIADVMEVLDALTHSLEISYDEINKVKREKYEKKGGFEKGIVLLKTSASGSLTMVEDEVSPSMGLFGSQETLPIATKEDLKVEVTTHHDEKKTSEQLTKFLQIDFPLNLEDEYIKSNNFNLSLVDEKITIPFKASWLISRNGSNIRVRIEMQPQKAQGEQLGFEW